jgi:hypothetical protein
MDGVVRSFERLRRQLEAFSHRVEDQFQRLDAGRVLVGFEPTDRRLLGTDTACQPSLAEPVAPACLADQQTWGHEVDYNKFVIFS